MTAKQDLIAAALTAADELDFIYKHAPVEHSTDDLREAIARAMMQPGIPTEDQIQRHKIRAGDCPPDSEVLLVRSVRRFAEKAAPHPVGEPAENSFEWFQREIQRLQQHVADTWPDWMKRTSGLSTATFPTVGEEPCDVTGQCAEKVSCVDVCKLRAQPVSEVPMPDTCGELSDGRKIFDEADVRIYGEQCRDAGYAAGVAAVRDYAVMRWCAEVSNRPLVNTHRRTLDDTWRQVIRHTGGDPETLIGPCHDVLVALRGDVK